MKSIFHASWFLSLSLIMAGTAAATWRVEQPILFTDERVIILGSRGAIDSSAEDSLLTPDGWQKPRPVRLSFHDGRATLPVSGEGIHRIFRPGEEVRFLAINPPPKLTTASLKKTLPATGEKLLRGERFTILAIGDSVTATGNYALMLGRMLSRATGNPNIKVEIRAHPGSSVDASVRLWKKESAGLQPDLGLIMYGLNDQGAGVPLAAYVEQYRWLAERLKDGGADVVLLEPTPHINISAAAQSGAKISESSIFRTIIHAGAVRNLGTDLHVPVAATFDAIWDGGARTLQATAARLGAFYPPHFREQYRSLIETDNKGDSIHPNALGHLALAKAVFEAISGHSPKAALSFSATTSWEEGKPVSRMTTMNISSSKREGVLTFYPFPERDDFQRILYSLEPAESLKTDLSWPGATRPQDLLTDPLQCVFAASGPSLQILDVSGDQSAIHAVPAPWDPAVYFIRERQVAETNLTTAHLQVDATTRSIPVTIPKDSAVGRIPLEKRVDLGAQTAWAVAEMVYTKFGAAPALDATVDGSLSEWRHASWVPVGEPVQARSPRGGADNRARPEECYTRWTFSAARNGMFLAFSGTGDLERDSVTIYFDSRPAEELGSAGPYFWVDGGLAANGTILLKAGDSSPDQKGLRGAWHREKGSTTGELFIPYATFGKSEWQAGEDLGVSIVWKHRPADGKPTTLMWAENGHPWNTRWFGVVRREPKGTLPYRVRVE